MGAAVHAHPPTATGYAVAGKSLDEYSMIETVIAIGSISLTPYGTPSKNEVLPVFIWRVRISPEQIPKAVVHNRVIC